jgi:hypothetical protein
MNQVLECCSPNYGAYFGDQLGFYLDRKFEESFLESAKEKKNIFKHGKQLGFKAFGKTSSVGAVNCVMAVPAKTQNSKIEPNMNYSRND